MNWRRLITAVLGMVMLVSLVPVVPVAAAEQCFAETNKCVGDRFYQYWQEHGGLAQQGLPITNAFSEVVTAPGPLKGKSITVQYFERARFEYHPEIADPKFQVLLGLVGTEQLTAKYPGGEPTKGTGCVNNEALFVGGKYCVSGLFSEYWRTHGGLEQQGYPISKAFAETNPSDGKQYAVQYFERARFEYHPEFGPENQVLLGLLGGEQFRAKYPGGEPKAAPPPPAAPPAGSAVPIRVTGAKTGVSQTFTLKAGLAIFRSNYTGSSNFITHLIDSRLNTVCYVTNDIGSTQSSKSCEIPANGTYRFDVKSSGTWSIEVVQPGPIEFGAATGLGARFTGSGSQVTAFFIGRTPGLALGLHYKGKSNFIVHVVDSRGRTVGYAANEIGTVDLSALVRLDEDGVYFLEVQSSGTWSIDVVQHTP